MLGVFAYSLIMDNYGMWKKSISILKKLIFFCNAYKVYKYKLVAYKYLIILNRKLK